MAVTINGTTGIAGVDGSASTPAVQGTDTNTGIFFPAADTIAFGEGGAEVMRIDSSGNVGIGTTSPSDRLQVNGASAANTQVRVVSTATAAERSSIEFFNNTISRGRVGGANDFDGLTLDSSTTESAAVIRFRTGGGTLTERARITSGGVFCFGKTSDSTTTAGSAIGTNGVANFVASTASPSDGPQIQVVNIASSVANGYRFYSFRINSGATEVGSITTNGSNATSYVTSSDYRLKENVAPMTGALSKIAQLKPSTWTWKNGGTNGQGFIAHELAEVCPDAVVGEKDAVEIYTDEEGNEQTRPRYQGVDTSFLVATLTAAIQELKSELDAAKARIAVLEAK